MNGVDEKTRNEEMSKTKSEKQSNNTEPIEITKARSRVTTNTPAFQNNTSVFLIGGLLSVR